LSANTGNVSETKRTLISKRKLVENYFRRQKFLPAFFPIVLIFENLYFTW